MPPGPLRTPVWISSDELFVAKINADFTSELWRFRGDQGEQLALPSFEGCANTHELVLYGLSDHRLGLKCGEPDGINASLVAFDVLSSSAQLLAHVPNVPSGQAVWSPGLTDGFYAEHRSTCASIVRIRNRSIERFANPVTLDGKVWFLDGGFFQKDDSDLCHDLGRSGLPMLAGDGKTMLFMASPAAMGKIHDERLLQPWNVYTAAIPGIASPVAIARDFVNPKGASMSPRGDFLIVAAVRDGKAGLWRIGLDGGKIDNLAKGRFRDPAIAPDGNRVAVIVEDGGSDQLRVLELGSR